MLNDMIGTNNPAHAAGWTEERVELLKKLWLEGLSASQIAGILKGGVTRNGVIGKVARLKLASHGTNHQSKPKVSKPKVPRAHRPEPPERHGNAGQPKANAIVHRVTTAASAPAFVEPPEEGVDVTRLLGLMQLNEHTCKWPIGDPFRPGFGFCGAHVDVAPYCNAHRKRAFHHL